MPRSRLLVLVLGTVLLAAVLSLFFFMGRAGGPDMAASTRSTSPARDFLFDQQVEHQGYGLYSYLLFLAPPPPEVKERYRAAVAAFLELDPVDELVEYLPDASINVTYLPLHSGNALSAPDPDSIISNYNYARARALLSGIRPDLLSGPYIISATSPLVPGQAPPDGYLWQDLSRVPPRLVRLWLREYLVRSVNQDGFAGDAARVSWTLRLRTGLATAAEGVPEVKAALDTLVRWVKRAADA